MKKAQLELLNRLITATPDNTKLEVVVEAGIFYIANAIVQAENKGADVEDLQTQVEKFIRNAVILMRLYRNAEKLEN